jgi:hypothetical protein
LVDGPYDGEGKGKPRRGSVEGPDTREAQRDRERDKDKDDAICRDAFPRKMHPGDPSNGTEYARPKIIEEQIERGGLCAILASAASDQPDAVEWAAKKQPVITAMPRMISGSGRAAGAKSGSSGCTSYSSAKVEKPASSSARAMRR